MHPELFTIPWIKMAMPSWGAMLAVGFLAGTWWMVRRAARVKADPDIVLNVAIMALILSLVGARTFYVIHYWDSQFADHPGQIVSLSGKMRGFEFYGGLVGGILPGLLYLWRKGLSIRLYLDLVTPSILLGLGIGRIGCFLFGCCWGGPCPPDLPWAVTFPYGSPAHQRQWQERQATLPAELLLIDSGGAAVPMPRLILDLTPANIEKLEAKLQEASAALEEARQAGDAEKIAKAEADRQRLYLGLAPVFGHFGKFGLVPAKAPLQLKAIADRPAFRPQPLHPVQLYAAIGALLLAWLTSAYFYRRQRHGTVMAVGLMLYAPLRFVEEIIRIDNPHDTLGLTVSQALSAAIFLSALLAMLVLRKMPLRSPKPAAPAPRAAAKAAETETAREG